MMAFDEVREQIDWAETRINEADSEIAAYIQHHAFTFLEEVNAETGERQRKIKLAKPVPMSIKGHLRNAIVDLKHAFDMALNAAASELGSKRFEKTFPWANSPTGVKAIVDSWQRKAKSRSPQILVDEVWRQEPYSTGESFSGGDDLTREVAKMANNKHSIGITASAQIASISFTNVTVESTGGPIEIFRSWDPKKQELLLARYTGTISHDDPQVTGNVFFERVGGLGALPAIPTAKTFLQRAKLSVEGFEAIVHTSRA